jgi:hypothetical protein
MVGRRETSSLKPTASDIEAFREHLRGSCFRCASEVNPRKVDAERRAPDDCEGRLLAVEEHVIASMRMATGDPGHFEEYLYLRSHIPTSLFLRRTPHHEALLPDLVFAPRGSLGEPLGPAGVAVATQAG